MTANPFAALLRDVSRYNGHYRATHGEMVRYSDVLAALAAAYPADLAEAGKVLERLAVRTSKRLAPNWKEGRKCPECDADAMRQKCMWEMGGACPRHDPSNYEPSPYETVPDRDCKDAADLITALIARIAAQRSAAALYEQLNRHNARRAEAAETALAAMTKERDEMRAAIFGKSDYDPNLRNGNFREMAETLHAANAGGRSALAAERAKTAKLVKEATEILEQIDKGDGMPISTIGLRAAITEASQ